MKNIKIKKKHDIGLKGIYTFTFAKLKTKAQWALHAKIEKFMQEGKEYIHLVRQLNNDCTTRKLVVENLIPTIARAMIANNLASSSPDDTMLINYTALGTGSTAVANSDTTLDTEVYRKLTASYTNADNVAYVTAFYTATEDTGTYKEAGLFSNASASADSGVLFSRVLLNAPTGIAKSVTETLTLDYVVQIN